ncbi:MAG TPA: hypothetical protein VGI61_08140 [Parafilimonas sp.]
MKKIHILVVENRENEIEFFTEALEESGLSFLCNTARNTEQAFKILKNSVPDAIFIDTNIMHGEAGSIKKIKSLQKIPVIFYSTVLSQKSQQSDVALNYVQLPRSIHTMAGILKNLFIENKVDY